MNPQQKQIISGRRSNVKASQAGLPIYSFFRRARFSQKIQQKLPNFFGKLSRE